MANNKKRTETQWRELVADRDHYEKRLGEAHIQLANALERNDELLAEIRMYEHETATLRHIITDALRQKD